MYICIHIPICAILNCIETFGHGVLLLSGRCFSTWAGARPMTGQAVSKTPDRWVLKSGVYLLLYNINLLMVYTIYLLWLMMYLPYICHSLPLSTYLYYYHLPGNCEKPRLSRPHEIGGGSMIWGWHIVTCPLRTFFWQKHQAAFRKMGWWTRGPDQLNCWRKMCEYPPGFMDGLRICGEDLSVYGWYGVCFNSISSHGLILKLTNRVCPISGTRLDRSPSPNGDRFSRFSLVFGFLPGSQQVKLIDFGMCTVNRRRDCATALDLGDSGILGAATKSQAVKHIQGMLR